VYRAALEMTIADENMMEMDQDYDWDHKSNPDCQGMMNTYSNNYGDPDWNWQPAACGGGGGSGGGGGTYVGCFTDDSSRALPAFQGEGYSIDACISQCGNQGYAYSGSQWYGQCFCGNSLGYVQVSDAECNTPCSSGGGYCGGPWRNSIYVAGGGGGSSDPNSCWDTGSCGGQAPGGCYCDDVCVDYGDCCFDGPC
jgi:hypothetical protein